MAHKRHNNGDTLGDGETGNTGATGSAATPGKTEALTAATQQQLGERDTQKAGEDREPEMPKAGEMYQMYRSSMVVRVEKVTDNTVLFRKLEHDGRWSNREECMGINIWGNSYSYMGKVKITPDPDNKVKMVVIHESMLGYVLPRKPDRVFILSTDTGPIMHARISVMGPMYYEFMGDEDRIMLSVLVNDSMRLATKEDFEKYKVPFGLYEGSELHEYGH